MYDSDLQAAFNLINNFGIDHKGLFLTFIVGVGLVVFIIVVAKVAVGHAVNEIHTVITKQSTADSYFAASARGDKEAMAKFARQDSLEQRGLM